MTIDDLYPGDIFEYDSVVYFVARSWTGKPYFVSEWQGYTEDEMEAILKGEPGIIRHDGRWYFTND